MLRTTDFTAHGWATARVTDSYARLPDPPIIPCATIAPGQVGLVEGNAGAWSSEHTTARETVAVYTDAGLAEKDFGRLLNEISNCNGSDVELTSFAHTTTASGVDDIRWFNTSGPGEARGVIGVIRNTDRLALVFISSPDSNPDDTHAHGTTDIATVLSIAGQRLR